MAKIPKTLQPILWSQDIKTLGLKRDRIYIINQVLQFGSVDDLKWLFKTYPKKTIKEVFSKSPLPIYTPSSYNFTKNLLLKVKQNLNEIQYLKNIV